MSWASRWDIYLGMSDVEIHWFSITNSLVVVSFLSGKYTSYSILLSPLIALKFIYKVLNKIM